MNVAVQIRDAARLAWLSSYNVLETPEEQAFDDLAHLAAELCETPVALVSFVDVIASD